MNTDPTLEESLIQIFSYSNFQMLKACYHSFYCFHSWRDSRLIDKSSVVIYTWSDASIQISKAKLQALRDSDILKTYIKLMYRYGHC